MCDHCCYSYLHGMYSWPGSAPPTWPQLPLSMSGQVFIAYHIYWVYTTIILRRYLQMIYLKYQKILDYNIRSMVEMLCYFTKFTKIWTKLVISFHLFLNDFLLISQMFLISHFLIDLPSYFLVKIQIFSAKSAVGAPALAQYVSAWL